MTTKPRMLTYNRQGDIDYGSLSFDPFKRHVPPDAMIQDLPLQEVVHILSGRFTNFGERPDVFFSANTIICHDRSNLNVHVSPDCYMAFGVDARAIRDRHLYLPWEVRKPPDWALEAASPSTGRRDVVDKRLIYARMGISEYWRFDSTGGDIYGDPLVGERLVNGVYQPFDLTAEPDGVLKGYSPTLELYLCWANHKLYLYDPVTRTYLRNVVQLEEALQQERAALEQERAAREAVEAESRQLREELRRRDSEG